MCQAIDNTNSWLDLDIEMRNPPSVIFEEIVSADLSRSQAGAVVYLATAASLALHATSVCSSRGWRDAVPDGLRWQTIVVLQNCLQHFVFGAWPRGPSLDIM